MSFLHSGPDGQPLQAQRSRNFASWSTCWRQLPCTRLQEIGRRCDSAQLAMQESWRQRGSRLRHVRHRRGAALAEHRAHTGRRTAGRPPPAALTVDERRPAARAGARGGRRAHGPRSHDSRRHALPIVLDDCRRLRHQPRRTAGPRAPLARGPRARRRRCCREAAASAASSTDATRSAKVKGRAHVAVRFDSLDAARRRRALPASHTATIGRAAPATKKKDALKIGAARGRRRDHRRAARRQEGRGRSAAAAGGGAGTAVVLSTRGKEVHLAKGTPLTLRLSQPLTVRLSADREAGELEAGTLRS